MLRMKEPPLGPDTYFLTKPAQDYLRVGMVAGASARYRGRTRRPDFPSNPILPSFREQIIRGTGDKPFDPLPDTIGFTAMFTTPFDHETPQEAFVLGDKVQDKIVVRYIFEVPRTRIWGKESDAIAGRVFDMAGKLAEFAGYFIWERTNYEPR